LHLAETRLRQGAFARRELPRFHATVPPSDSRHGRPAVICSRRALHPQHALPLVHRAGSPRFLDGSVGARRPQSPRRARPLRVLVTSRSMAGFTLSGGMATLNGLTRPNQVHAFALRLTPLPHMASTDGSPRQPHDRLHGERAIAMVSTFQLTRSTRLCLAHRSTRRDGRHRYTLSRDRGESQKKNIAPLGRARAVAGVRFVGWI
jgi:hypothetical protein